MDREKKMVTYAKHVNDLMTRKKSLLDERIPFLCDYEIAKIRIVFSDFCRSLWDYYEKTREREKTVRIYQMAIQDTHRILRMIRTAKSMELSMLEKEWREAQPINYANHCAETEELSFESEEIYRLFNPEEEAWDSGSDDNGYHTLPNKLKALYAELFSERDDKRLANAPEVVLWHVNNDDASQEDKAQWINLFFADCMLPVEFSESVWKEKRSVLQALLKEQDKLLKESDTFKSAGIRTAAENHPAYEAVLYWFAGDLIRFYDKVAEAFEITCDKAEYLLAEGREHEFLTCGLQQRFSWYLPGMDKAQEPLALIIEEAASCGMASRVHQYYAEYMCFLEDNMGQDRRYFKEILYQLLTRMGHLSVQAVEESEAEMNEKEISPSLEKKYMAQNTMFKNTLFRCRQRRDQLLEDDDCKG